MFYIVINQGLLQPAPWMEGCCVFKMSVNELEEGDILDDSLENSDDEGEVKEVSHIDIYSIEKSIMPSNNNQSNDSLSMSKITEKMPKFEDVFYQRTSK